MPASYKVSEFDRWVSDNNIPQSFEYGKGWWDYIELVRRFAWRLDTDDVRVVGHYVVDTPPPCERLPMPAVALATPGVTFALRLDFGSWSLKHREIGEWAVSVVRPTWAPCSGSSMKPKICGCRASKGSRRTSCSDRIARIRPASRAWCTTNGTWPR